MILRLIIILSIFGSAFAMEIDEKLSYIQKIYSLSPKNCNNTIASSASTDEIKIGELLFSSKLLSGNNDIACINCHLDEFHAADGLPLAIGAGGKGKGIDRVYHGQGSIVARNAISLIGSGHKSNRQFFWDGKVSRDEDDNRYSPLGKNISEKFENTLAIAAILPITERDELVGSSSLFKSNEIRKAVNNNYYDDKFNAVSEQISKRLTDLDSSNELKTLLSQMDQKNLDLVDVGNFLSKFIANKFKCNESKFDKYLKGDNEALTDNEKKGAILFYGKGRCASCHSGELFSDNKFHSIGVYQGDFGPHPRHRDIGRAGVTYRLEDEFKFRTPKLIDISKTAPYGHNGAFSTLKDVVVYHFNPIMYLRDISNLTIFSPLTPTLDSRDKVLSTIRISDDDELNNLISFLNTL